MTSLYDAERAHDLDVATLIRENELSGTRLPVASSQTEDSGGHIQFQNQVEHMPKVQLENFANGGGTGKQYTVCRYPRPLKDSMNSHTSVLLIQRSHFVH